MTRRDAKGLGEVLTATVNQIQRLVEDADPGNCYISLDPLKVTAGRPKSFFYVVTPIDGVMDEGNMSGGGTNQATADTEIAVTIHAVTKLDRVDEHERFMLDTELGIIDRANAVLEALNCVDLQGDDGIDILYEPMMASSYTTGYNSASGRGWWQWKFQQKFDWET